jgi:hypothetical protein
MTDSLIGYLRSLRQIRGKQRPSCVGRLSWAQPFPRTWMLRPSPDMLDYFGRDRQWCRTPSVQPRTSRCVRNDAILHGPLQVNRVTLTVGRPRPVYPDQRTSSGRPGMSGWCQSRSLPPTVRTSCYAPSVQVGAAGTSPSWHNPYRD